MPVLFKKLIMKEFTPGRKRRSLRGALGTLALVAGFSGWTNSGFADDSAPNTNETSGASPAATKSAVAADATSAGLDESYQYMLLFSRVLQIVRQNYVDPNKVGYKELTYAALRGMLASLDPHSQFLDEDAFADLQRETRGGPFAGLGIVVGLKDDATIIVSPMEDSPAGRAGLLPGDRILRINGRTTEHLSLATVGDMLKGQVGEKAGLTIMRPNAPGSAEGRVFEVSLTREVIQLHSVKDPHLLPAAMAGADRVGYVRITEFGGETAADFDRALDDLEAQGIQALVIDLRNNGGGLVDTAVSIAGEFVPAGTTIVSLKGRGGGPDQVFSAKGERRRGDYPVALLINGYSASAAEIMSGAFKDLRRGLLVGEQTFGKGSVQTVLSLGDGIGLRLTTARYYTPSGRSIHEVGITPDLVVPITNNDERRIILSQAKRALTVEEKSEAAQADDRQLQRAVSALRAVRVYRARQLQGLAAAPTSAVAAP